MQTFRLALEKKNTIFCYPFTRNVITEKMCLHEVIFSEPLQCAFSSSDAPLIRSVININHFHYLLVYNSVL